MNEKHTCGFPLYITTSIQQGNKSFIFVDDDPNSPSFGETITTCPKCQEPINANDFESLNKGKKKKVRVASCN